MKIIIAGSRDITDYKHVEDAMRLSNAANKVTEVISGGARGVDTLAIAWAKKHKIPFKVMKADWNNLDVPGAIIFVRPGEEEGYYNANAGKQRNEDMGRYGDACVAIWNGVSGGTKHMIEFMKGLGKKVYVHKVQIERS